MKLNLIEIHLDSDDFSNFVNKYPVQKVLVYKPTAIDALLSLRIINSSKEGNINQKILKI